MKAMVLHEPNTPFVLEERPVPEPGPGEAVAKVLACGSGLTIHHTKRGRVGGNFPLVIGHEITGEISAIGPEVKGVSEGDPVTAHFYLTCGHCKWCRLNRETLCENFAGYIGRQIDGGYAEYMKAPARNFLPIPKGLDYKKHPAEVAVICDAIATPYKVVRWAPIAPLENVAIMGAGGGLGIHMVMVARWAGARVLAVDIGPEKLDKCREVGAHETVDASQGKVVEALMDLTGGKGVDVVVDFVSSTSTLAAGVDAIGNGGRLITLGAAGETFPLSGRQLLLKEAMVKGSKYVTKQELLESLDLVVRGDIWPLVTETYKLEDAEKAHDRVEQSAVIGRAALLME